MWADPSLEGVVKAAAGEAPPIMIRTRRKTIVPRSGTQIRYTESLASDDIIFALGAGSITEASFGTTQDPALRSEEHTSELPVTNAHLVCRLLLEKKNTHEHQYNTHKL